MRVFTWDTLETPSPEIAALLVMCDHKTALATKYRTPVGFVAFGFDGCGGASKAAFMPNLAVQSSSFAQADVIRFKLTRTVPSESNRALLEFNDTPIEHIKALRGFKPLPKEG